MQIVGSMNHLLAFGPFRLDAEAGLVFHGDAPTPLGRRCVALVNLLVSRAGTPVSKQDLFEAAWPNQAVEDSNLTVQIASVRRLFAEKAGGAHWIETLPRHGYRYVGPNPTPESAAPGLPDRPSIAVLPFSILGGEALPEYFADGMVEDIIRGLARISRLFVIARSSTLGYRGPAVDITEVGRRLGVRYVLLGNLRKVEVRLRVSVQLIDAITGSHIWAERFDRKLEDFFALQDEIGLQILGTLAPNLQKAEIDRARRKGPESLDAYDLVMRSQRDVDSGMPDRVARALTLLDQAIALEPACAIAHGNAAMCHHCLFLRAGLKDENRSASIRHAREAILHGRDDASALALGAFSMGMDGHDRGTALAAFEAALAQSPSCANAYILGSVVLGWGGEAARAIEWSAQGLRLSPFDPWAFAAYDAQAMSHLLQGDFEQASQAAYRSVQTNPAHSITYVQLAAALAKLGRVTEARAAAVRVLELQPGFRYGRHFAGVNCDPTLAAVLGEALGSAGLPI